MTGRAAVGIEVRNLVKTYGRVRALGGVTFAVPVGTVTGLLGPNGAGKSTLMQVLTGLFAPDSGEVLIGSIPVAREPVHALAQLGIVFQQPSLDLDLTVAQNLSYYAGLTGLTGSARARAIAQALALFGLQDSARSHVRTLSGGTRRKIELSRALMADPTVILLDEPTQGLDPASRREIVGHVRDLAASRGLAVLWATHLVDEVESADSIVVLHKGTVMMVGRPADLLATTGAGTLEDAFLALTRSAEPKASAR